MAGQAAGDGAADGREETDTERADRNWNELLQELRVTETGVQVLTGFLLTVPFQQRFTELDRFQRGTYVVAVLLSATATMLMVSPVSWHRVLFRQRRKPQLVAIADRFARAGLVTLAAAITAVVVLVIDVVSGGRWIGVVVGGMAALVFALFWLVLPVVFRQRRSRA